MLSQAWNIAWRLLFAAINSLRKLKTTTKAVLQQDSDFSFSLYLGSKCNAICNIFFLPFIFEKQVVLYCAWLIFLVETQVSRAAFIHLFSTSMITPVFLRCYSVRVSPLHYSPPPRDSSHRRQWTWKSPDKRGSLNLCCFLSISSTQFFNQFSYSHASHARGTHPLSYFFPSVNVELCISLEKNNGEIGIMFTNFASVRAREQHVSRAWHQTLSHCQFLYCPEVTIVFRNTDLGLALQNWYS